MEFDYVCLTKEIKSDLDKFAKQGKKVVVRFPPEPSGHLHIGHVKALSLNYCIAKKYNGSLIVRMDDTNPLLESLEYETSILEDIDKLGIKYDKLTHSSDYFNYMLETATKLITKGVAYVDLTNIDVLRQQRTDGKPSEYRDTTVDVNLEMWKEMQEGTLTNCCLRLRSDYQDLNKAMRDPSIYRPVNAIHHMWGDKFKVYPTYDFACPLVDTIEGVTHVFRSVEFMERDAQYDCILGHLGIEVPKLYHYGKLNVEGSILSKRKIKAAIEEGKYTGWDDPRLYTFKGIMNRGFNLKAMDQFLKDSGYPKSNISTTVDKIWSLNEKIIDKISTRFTALNLSVEVKLILSEDDKDFDLKSSKEVLKFHRNPELGKKNIYYSDSLLLDKVDYDNLQDNEEVTLMNFGNVIFRNGELISNLKGDFKKTSKKLLWLPQTRDGLNLTKVEVISFNGDVKATTIYQSEPDLRLLGVGNYVQFLKLKYYIINRKTDDLITLIELP
jgi:glutamyl-tRNA synthetase